MSSPFQLPSTLQLGTATAALQIEGGDRNNSWYRWAERGRIKDGSHCIVAADHWNRVAEDVELMRSLNMRHYRMGIEWSRIEPEPGRIDDAALRHYRNELERLHRAGIRPMLTLHHFSQPIWFEDSGGWERDDAPEIFARYVRIIAEALGDLVTEWITINEPNVYLVMGYVFGEWPPGISSIKRYLHGSKCMIRAHHRAYEELHRAAAAARRPCKVGAAHHIRVFDPLRPRHPMDRFATALYRSEFQWLFVSGMTTGKLAFPVRRDREYERSLSAARAEAPNPPYVSDFIAVNYYSRDMLRFVPDAGRAFAAVHTKAGSPTNDLGWEIYPEGLSRVLADVSTRYPLPIYITENGTCDATDSFRARFIYDHLRELVGSIGEGAPVERYYHWSLLDNFEWLEGLSIRFGLVHVDYETQKRSIRPSGTFYGEIARQRGVTEAMIRRYLEP